MSVRLIKCKHCGGNGRIWKTINGRESYIGICNVCGYMTAPGISCEVVCKRWKIGRVGRDLG